MVRRFHNDVLIATSRGADDRKTLAAVRTMGRAGWRVGVASNALCRPAFSRHCRARRRYGDAASLLSEAARWSVFLPLDDETTLAAARRPAVTCCAVPPLQSLEISHDKVQTGALADRLGIPTPAFYTAASVQFPCVVKPRHGAGGIGFRHVATEAELGLAPDLIIQEHVSGEVEDVCLLFAHGEPRAVMTQRRLRMRPRHGGPGVHNETTDRPELAEHAIALLRALEWHGPAQVEFKGGRLLDLNGRFWGTLGLAIRAGIDFPRLTCRLALDGDVASVHPYRVGLRQRWWGLSGARGGSRS